MKQILHRYGLAAFCLAWLAAGCGSRDTAVDGGGDLQVFHMGNGDEIEDVDPHITTGVTEHTVLGALFEGLVTLGPKDLEPRPGVAERWEISDDKMVYTFYLREDAKWSNGDPVTAQHFHESFRRILTPSLGAEYANMLFVAKNAEAFYNGEIQNFEEVGFRVIDDRTLEITLIAPTPYFMNMLGYHYTWWAVHIPTVKKFGGMTKKGTAWTRPENIVSNGPFILKDWKINQYIEVDKNPMYWDAENVALDKVMFYPIQSLDTEERAFRSGQLHVTYEMPRPKIATYREENPEVLHIDPYLGVYFYRVNVTRQHLKDKRVRKALALSIDRRAIVEGVTRDGALPAYCMTPPDTAGYTARASFDEDVDRARALLAEAGYPGGQGFPPVQILFNTQENHKMIAEAIQQMWKKNLNIQVTLANQEWKVYLDTQDTLNYDVSRSGWIGDYIDPNTFLQIFKTGDGNNDTGWGNPRYDELLDQAALTADEKDRYGLLQQAEEILIEEMPVIPIYHYVKPYLLKTNVEGYESNILNHHPLKYVSLK